MTDGYNPRYVLWAKSRGKEPEDFGRDENGDIERILDEDDEQRRMMSWTVVFMLWIEARWTDWAAHHGFMRTRYGDPHREAMLAGHRDFDVWLEGQVNG